MWWLLVLVILLILCCLLLMMPVKVNFWYQRHGSDDLCQVKISSFGGLIKVNIAIPIVEQRFNWLWPYFRFVFRSRAWGVQLKEVTYLKPPEWSWDGIRLWLIKLHSVLSAVKPSMSYVLSKGKIQQLSLQTKLGTEDAAATGILTGLVWGLNSTFFAWLTHRVGKVEASPSISVVPVFNAPTFAFDIHCIFEVGAGHIIIAGVTAIRNMWRQRG